jgi:molecular chaperone GrpE
MSDESKKIDPTIADSSAEQSPESSNDPQRLDADNPGIENLRQQLQAKEEEAKNNYDRFLRQVAELENFKKRTLRDKEDSIRFANEYLIRDLLPVLDNLERAVTHAKGGGNGRPLVDGVEMVLKGFFDVLSKHGVTQIAAAGQPFDPAKHEAMAQVETDAYAPNTVVEEHHKGYLFHDRLLRPALVSVAKSPDREAKKNAAGEVENDPADD